MPSQKRVDKHGKYISAHQQGLQARHRLTLRGLVVLMIVIVAIIAAFTAALAWKAHGIGKIEDMLNKTRVECAKQVTEIKKNVGVYKDDIQQKQQSMNEKIQKHTQKIEKIEDLEKSISDLSLKLETCKCHMNRVNKEFQDVTGRPGHRVPDSDTEEYHDDDD